MREIKFRCWDIESPYMLSWDEIEEQWQSEGYHPAIFSNDHYRVMQYTGLLDKNGVEIYEGDICQITISDYFSNDSFTTEGCSMDGKVVFENCLWLWGFDDSWMTFSDYLNDDSGDIEIEVIGNVHESQS